MKSDSALMERNLVSVDRLQGRYRPNPMNLKTNFPAWLRVLCLVFVLSGGPAFADNPPAPGTAEVIVSEVPMKLVAEGTGVSGQFVVAHEILSAETGNDLIYTVTVGPRSGRVGLAGGDNEDFFLNTHGRSGYFAYRPQDGFLGEDSFTYTVRNETSGLVFQNTVVIEVKPAAPVIMEKFVVSGARERVKTEQVVTLTTRPNT